MEERLRVLKDYRNGLFTSVRQSGTFDTLARKYGVDIVLLDSNQPFATQSKTGYNMMKVLLRKKFARYANILLTFNTGLMQLLKSNGGVTELHRGRI